MKFTEAQKHKALWPTLIRNERKRMQVSQAEFGRMFGVTHSTVHHWEKGTASPNSEMCWYLYRRLDARLAKLAGIVGELEKAYGGCKVCYGKGYATVNGQWVGHDTDQDIGSPGGTIRGGNQFEMQFCTCPRGQQLKTLLNKDQ